MRQFFQALLILLLIHVLGTLRGKYILWPVYCVLFECQLKKMKIEQ